VIEISNIVGGTGTNQRERNTVLLKSAMIGLYVKNNDAKRLTFRWAVLSPKTDQANVVTDFLRGYDGERAGSLNTTRSGLELAHNAINSAKYGVIKQGKFHLAGSAENTNVEKNQKDSMMRVKLNKKLMFDTLLATSPYKSYYFVMWWDTPVSAAGGATYTTGVVQYDIKVFFHDAI
jgi:hypothetical protein